MARGPQDAPQTAVDALLEAELDRWRAARRRQTLIEGRWGAPPPVPVCADWKATVDPTGRRALLMGYRAVHLLDLREMTTRVLITDSRSDRVAGFTPDGERAAVLDGYGQRLYWITFDGAPQVVEHPWNCPRSMRGDLALTLSDTGLVAATGRDLDGEPLRIHWIDGPSGAVRHTAKFGAGQVQTNAAVAGLRFVGAGPTLRLWLDDPESAALEVEPAGPKLARPATAIDGTYGPWRLTTGKRWRLRSNPSAEPISVPPCRSAPVLSDGPRTGRIAVALDGRVRICAVDSGQPLSERIGPPARGHFDRVEQMILTDDRLWIVGEARPSPFAADAGPLLAGYRRDGDTWHPLGAVLLADRPPAPRPKNKGKGQERGQRMSNVYVRGRQLTVAELEAAGITFVGSDDSEAEEALARFACPHGDPYDRELPFARTPRGVFGRLDDARSIGPEAAGPFEKPAWTRTYLRGETPDLDAASAAALADWQARFDFWTAEDGWATAKALPRLMDASAGLGDLLPEIVHRAQPRKRTGLAAPGALARVAERMHRPSSTEREDTVFREMLVREERRLLPQLLAERLQTACPSLTASEVAEAVDGLERAVEAVADAAEYGPGAHLKLTDIAAGAALIDLLRAAAPDLNLAGLDLSRSGVDDIGLSCLVAAPWLGLRTLGLAGTAVTDRGALALAAADIGELAAVDLANTAVTAGGHAALQWSPTLPALGPSLSIHESWAGLLGLKVEADRVPVGALDALWAATPASGDGVRSAASPEGPTLELEDMPLTPTGVELLAAHPRTADLARLALRRCDLHVGSTPALLKLTRALPAHAALDLSHNGLPLAFALQLAIEQPPFEGSLDLTGNPLEPAAWGALRGTFGPRLTGAPDAATEQLLALARFTDLGPTARAQWLGRALALDPTLAQPLLDGLTLDENAQRQLLAGLSSAATANADRDLWRALTAWALRLADGTTSWWLGDVGCGLENGTLNLRPRRPLTDARLQIQAEPDASRLRKLLSGQDVLTGDEAFDRIALIAGESNVALAVLDAETRASLGPWLARGFGLHDGSLTGPAPDDPAAIAQLARAAARLALPEDRLPAVWARRLADEPDPGAALLLAKTLVAEAAIDPSLLDTDLALFDTAAASGIEAARRLIGGVLARHVDPSTVSELGPAGAAAALEHASGDLRAALVERLHHIGDERAVAPLTAIAGAFFGGGALKKAARAAVEAIVERQGGLRAGGLTVVAGTPTGGLSVSDEAD